VKVCSFPFRKPYQRGVASTYKDMYKLKWRVSLDEVEVCDGSRRNSNEREREVLHADFITMQQISKLQNMLNVLYCATAVVRFEATRKWVLLVLAFAYVLLVASTRMV